MRGSTCATCKHYVVVQAPQGSTGTCRRYPPTAMGGAVAVASGPDGGPGGAQIFSQTVWPVVGPADCCGEHAMAIALVN